VTTARLRNIILLVAGVAGLFFELIFRHPPDAGMIPIFLGMVGIGPFLPVPTAPVAPTMAAPAPAVPVAHEPVLPPDDLGSPQGGP